MMPIPELSSADVAFGQIDHMPKRDAIPDEFWRGHTPYNRAVSMWFFKGAKWDGKALVVDGSSFTPKDGVDANKALRAIKAVLGSFAPAHEHKEAACALMLSEWFDLSQPKAA